MLPGPLFFLILLALAHAVYAHPVVAHKRTDSNNATADVLSTLQSLGLTKLHDALVAHPAILTAASASPGRKTLLAPTDTAVQALPSWETSNADLFESTLLMHFLNGSFDLGQLQAGPRHTVGHSLTTSAKYANLPGGNGQAVALYASTTGSENRFVQEGVNKDTFLNFSSQVGDYFIQPINQGMTIPGNAMFTLGFIGGHQLLSRTLINVNSTLATALDDMRGLTIFAPTNRALRAFLATSPSNETISTVLKNHLVFNRAAYSPLLDGQGSLISASGQDISFNADNNTVRLGSDAAQVTQYDIMHRGGVIHLIDGVFSSTALDQSRADQAAASARASVLSNVAGPISVENAASSQGTDVPAGGSARNSTIDTSHFSGNSSASNNGGNSTSSGNGSSSSSSSSSSSGSGRASPVLMLGLPTWTLFSVLLVILTSLLHL